MSYFRYILVYFEFKFLKIHTLRAALRVLTMCDKKFQLAFKILHNNYTPPIIHKMFKVNMARNFIFCNHRIHCAMIVAV